MAVRANFDVIARVAAWITSPYLQTVYLTVLAEAIVVEDIVQVRLDDICRTDRPPHTKQHIRYKVCLRATREDNTFHAHSPRSCCRSLSPVSIRIEGPLRAATARLDQISTQSAQGALHKEITEYRNGGG